VDGLERALREQGYAIASKAEEIRAIKALDRNLGLIFSLLAAVGSVGYLLSLSVSLWANVDRKRRYLSLVRLMGIRRTDLIAFPLVQAVMIAAVGVALALGMFALVSTGINAMLSETLRPGGQVCRLEPEHVALAVAATMALAVVSAAASALRLARTAPSDALREV
jgi:putative ABC transport system permease protein